MMKRGKFEKCRHGSRYIHCNSLTPYDGRGNISAQEINKSLNLNLGLPINPRNIYILRNVCKILSDILSFVEVYLMKLWDATPARFRQILTMKSWSVYCQLHKRIWFLSNRTGIHPDASLEYHAFTTIAYWGAMFPVTLRRMRFALNQLCAYHGHDAYPFHSRKKLKDCSIEHITYSFQNSSESDKSPELELSMRPSKRPVHGYYIPHENSDKVLFYLFGGAYLGGNAKGNILFGAKISQRCKINIFLPDYSLVPEHHYFDACEDVIRSYEYLIKVRNIKPQNVILFGISSGGGLCVRLMQRIAEMNMNVQDRQPGLMPNGAVLLSPFVEYTQPRGTFKHYVKHDLIVNQSVFEEGIPYIATQGDESFMLAESPVNRSMEGLPPLCIIVSEHECCYDQNVKLCNRAREAGVHVDMAVWKFMCHVFAILSAFLPEAKGAVDFFCDWIDKRMEEDDDDGGGGGDLC